jgi:hypothetical protein
VDNFETYTTTSGLLSNWTGYGAVAGGLSLVTGGGSNVHSGNNALQVNYNCGLGHGVMNVFTPAPQDWTGGKFSFWYKGSANNSAEFLWLKTVDTGGGLKDYLYAGNYALTQAADWTYVEIDLTGDPRFPAYFNGIAQWQPAIQWGSGGTGTVYFDDFQVIPEPATMAILALGSWVVALRSRR